MAIENFFVKEGIKEAEIEEFLRKKFDRAGYSRIDIQRTALGTRIIVHANRPGIIIGKSGKTIKAITDEIQYKFGLENPMLDVKEVENPFLDAQIVAKRIAGSLERGSFYKRVVDWHIRQIMDAGAVGVEIKVAGKLGGQRGRFQKFKEGYIKHSGYYADNILDKGQAVSNLKPGAVGIQVKIMKDSPEAIEGKIKDIKVEESEDKGTAKTKKR